MATENTRATTAPSFEKSLERLESIVTEMESGSLDLEKMISRFEEGQELIKLCSKKLNQVERKIEILIKKEDGQMRPENFEDSGEAPAPELTAADGDDELF